ncbi:BP74-related protein [Methylococcus mesophilus]|uniref:BP74-related protein n=1 Tax=Methylococcus mesophilus TaxID=2993564 RepID=UPI00224ACDB8|nr:hypothetical protein [Methylococcus mesophilus]UZR28797.1 hypothetical protein OOT43_19135 [Methylococcus mesophilus]
MRRLQPVPPIWRTVILIGSCVCACSTPSQAAKGSVFVARDPYSVLVNGEPQAVAIGGVPITFDFGGPAPFIDPATAVGNFGALRFWDAHRGEAVTLDNRAAAKEAPDGIPGRIFKVKKGSRSYTAIGYTADDGAVDGTLGTRLDTYPVPSRRRFVWDFVVRFGGENFNSAWPFTPRGTHPGLVWELRADGMPPALAMVVDTDPDRPHKLALHFDANTGPGATAASLGIAPGLTPNKDIKVVIDAFLDERPQAEGGRGYVKAWVNGNVAVDAVRPTLSALATKPHHWTLGMQLPQDTSPLPFSLIGYWKRARMQIPKNEPMAAYFAFEQTSPSGRPLEIVFGLYDEIRIAQARALLADPASRGNRVSGKIVPKPAGYNPGWSYHLAPDSVSFFQMQAEVCDANAVYVEEHLSEVGGSLLPGGFWCPWSSRLSREIVP